jgi:predicted 3-demethylubiquinone-9 3-methyltransferase (glyoxalase superfamily)
MSKVTPFLWYEKQAEEAAQFYVSVFPNSHIVSGQGGGTTFELDGVRYIAFNGGDHFRLSPAVSLFVECEDQDEVDFYWDKLIEGGEPSRCGWLVDRFGLSWQVIPKVLSQLLNDPDPVKSGRVFQAMLTMIKLDVAGLRKAYAGLD